MQQGQFTQKNPPQNLLLFYPQKLYNRTKRREYMPSLSIIAQSLSLYHAIKDARNAQKTNIKDLQTKLLCSKIALGILLCLVAAYSGWRVLLKMPPTRLNDWEIIGGCVGCIYLLFPWALYEQSSRTHSISEKEKTLEKLKKTIKKAKKN
jgi:type VI protein secretion system component VasF